MGQRTLTVVKVNYISKDTTTNTDKEESFYRCYHEQWGYGCMALMGLIGLMARIYKGLFDEISSNNILQKQYESLLDNAYGDNEPYYTHAELTERGLLSLLDKNIGGLIEHHDNNNGLIYFEIYMDEYYNLNHGNIELYCGYGEDGLGGYHVGDKIPFSQWCKNFRRFCDKDFEVGYKALCKSLDVDVFDNIKGKKI